jgi:hypothetical protein
MPYRGELKREVNSADGQSFTLGVHPLRLHLSQRWVGCLFVVTLSLFPLLAVAETGPMIDAHLHYTGVDAAELPPEQVLALFDRNRIEAAARLGTAAMGR